MIIGLNNTYTIISHIFSLIADPPPQKREDKPPTNNFKKKIFLQYNQNWGKLTYNNFKTS